MQFTILSIAAFAALIAGVQAFPTQEKRSLGEGNVYYMAADVPIVEKRSLGEGNVYYMAADAPADKRSLGEGNIYEMANDVTEKRDI
ncbi:hypothetical protein BV22DRAFT_1041379 [Leucogyrophana mollusca]|uniref:Uncharacterized protein n=1 Tax=Leucogyrophana mollusca TaxID=85980 RepID=A0ACB8AZG2_9AGAM|nr:hypothetical protein BV22DRAFT_1041379 [Leucogyrophana mollusca]